MFCNNIIQQIETKLKQKNSPEEISFSQIFFIKKKKSVRPHNSGEKKNHRYFMDADNKSHQHPQHETDFNSQNSTNSNGKKLAAILILLVALIFIFPLSTPTRPIPNDQFLYEDSTSIAKTTVAPSSNMKPQKQATTEVNDDDDPTVTVAPSVMISSPRQQPSPPSPTISALPQPSKRRKISFPTNRDHLLPLQNKEECTKDTLVPTNDFLQRILDQHQNARINNNMLGEAQKLCPEVFEGKKSFNGDPQSDPVKTACADSWLKKCWFQSEKDAPKVRTAHNPNVQGLVTCSASYMRKAIHGLQPKKKHYVNREFGEGVVMTTLQFLKNDDLLLSLDCDTIREASRKICDSLSHREIAAKFTRKQTSEEKALSSAVPPPIETIQLKDYFSLNYHFNVLEAVEFKDPAFTDKKRDAEAKEFNEKTVIDVLCSGMFHENTVLAAHRWKEADEYYISLIKPRYTHVFQWNTMRDSRLRLVKATRLYGKELEERTKSLRERALKNNFRTWLTLDIDSPPANLKVISPLFSQVLVLRFIVVNYLTSFDEDFANSFFNSNNFPKASEEELSKKKRLFLEQNRLADFFFWIRPDLLYHPKHIAHPIRFNSTFGSALGLLGKANYAQEVKKRTRNYIFSADAEFKKTTHYQNTKYNNNDDGGTGNFAVVQTKWTPKALKEQMVDILMLANATGVVYMFRFVTSILHSCIWYPYPQYNFVEHWLGIAAQDGGMVVRPEGFGIAIDRGGSEAKPLPTATEIP